MAPSSRFTKSSKKATKLEALRVAVDAQSNRVIEENPMRTDFGEEFQALIDDYNSGSRNIEQLFEQLLKLSQSLSDEQRRCVHVGVTQDELVIFEILTRPSPALSPDEPDLVKKVAKRMLDRVKESLVIDWRSKQQPRAGIMLCIEDELDELPMPTAKKSTSRSARRSSSTSTKYSRKRRRGRAESDLKAGRRSQRSSSHGMDIPDLVPVFREHVTGFAAEPPEVQRGLAATFWACESADSRFAAKTREFGAYLSSKIMISIWGSYPKMTRSVGFRYFGALQGDNLSHKVNLYYPNPEFVEAFKAFIRSPQPLTTINAAGQPALKRKPRQAIDSETSSGARRRGDGQPSAYLPIRLEALRALRDDQLRPACRSSLYHLLTLSKLSSNPDKLPVRYVQHADSGGRLYEQNHLQGVTRHIRSVALAGLWDYDISNCHFTLISQLVKLRGSDTPAIDDYLRNKRDRRSQVRTLLEQVSSTCVDQNDVKSAIISLAYGASLGYSPALAALFDNPDVHNAFRQDPWVKELQSELRRCRDTLLGAYETNAGGYRILNRAGLQRSFSARDANRAFSFLVTGAEALILETVLKRWGPEVVLCIHDGWVAQSELSIVDMESEIRDKTGFEVTIEGGQIVPKTVVDCDGCAEYSQHRNREPDQWDSDVDVASNKTKGTTLVLGGGSEAPSVPGIGCGSSRRAYLGHPNDDPCFDADFRSSGLYVTHRCSWNVSPNFRGVTASGGRPRGPRSRRGSIKSLEILSPDPDGNTLK